MMDYSKLVGQVGGLGTTIWGLVDASNIFGSKPQVAPWKPVNYFGPSGAQQQSLTGNIGAFPEISQLGDLYQSYLTDQYSNAGIDIQKLIQEGSQSSQALLQSALPLEQGILPQSWLDAIHREAAQQNYSGGYAGSQMGLNNDLRQVGLGVGQGMQLGASLAGQATNSAQRWDAIAKGITLDPNQELVGPQEAYKSDVLNNLLQQQSQQNRYNVAAAPNPASAGSYGLLQSYFGSLAGGGGDNSQSGMGGAMGMLGSFI